MIFLAGYFVELVFRQALRRIAALIVDCIGLCLLSASHLGQVVVGSWKNEQRAFARLRHHK